mmetsp:Transcript_51609/g.160105  ORF Transcript_51609/g.160105 Transcript_51609/m.160105 type:complete len:246 (+) Transcript_51609:445-1182(+)
MAGAGARVARPRSGLPVVGIGEAPHPGQLLRLEDLRLRPAVPVGGGPRLVAPCLNNRLHHAGEIPVRKHLPRSPVGWTPTGRVEVGGLAVDRQGVHVESLVNRLRSIHVGRDDISELRGRGVAADVQELVLQGTSDDDRDGVVHHITARQDCLHRVLLQVDAVDHRAIPLTLGALHDLEGVLPLEAFAVGLGAVKASGHVADGVVGIVHGKGSPVSEAAGHQDCLLEEPPLFGHSQVHRDGGGAS